MSRLLTKSGELIAKDQPVMEVKAIPQIQNPMSNPVPAVLTPPPRWLGFAGLWKKVRPSRLANPLPIWQSEPLHPGDS